MTSESPPGAGRARPEQELAAVRPLAEIVPLVERVGLEDLHRRRLVLENAGLGRQSASVLRPSEGAGGGACRFLPNLPNTSRSSSAGRLPLFVTKAVSSSMPSWVLVAPVPVWKGPIRAFSSRASAS